MTADLREVASSVSRTYGPYSAEQVFEMYNSAAHEREIQATSEGEALREAYNLVSGAIEPA